MTTTENTTTTTTGRPRGGLSYPDRSAEPAPWEADARLTLRPDWCHLEVAGLALAVFPDRATGAPVLEVDTRALEETAGGPVMRLTCNDHDYLDNADGAGADMSPAAVVARTAGGPGLFNDGQSGSLVAVGDEHRRLVTELIAAAQRAVDATGDRGQVAQLDELTRRVGAAGLCNGEVVPPEDEDEQPPAEG